MCIHVPFTHTCTTKYHQNMIYLVGLPSVLYERPCQNERSVLNQLVFFFSSGAFHVLFMKSAPLFMKTKPCQYVCIHVPFTHTCYTYTTKYHQNMIYLVGLPSVLYKTPGQNKRSMLNHLFLLIFSAFHRKCWFHTKSATFHENQQKPGQYVCIHVPFIHTCTTTYQQKMIYLVGLPSVLYERPGQNETSVLNQMFLLFFRCFSVLFMCSSCTFHEKHHFLYKKCHFS